MSKKPSHPTLPVSLTQTDFAAIAEHCYRVTSAVVAEGGVVAPIVIAGTCRNGNLEVSYTSLVAVRSDRDKNRIARFMQKLVQRPRFDFVVHITEAWVLIGPNLPTGSIAQHPQRQEAVLFNILSKDCQTVVINPLHRTPSRLERGRVNFDLEVQGRFVRPTPARN